MIPHNTVSQQLNENAHVRWAHEEIEGSDLGDEKILVDFRQGRYFGLNPTGTFLFGLIRDGARIETLIDAVAERHGIERERASTDVFAFVESMQTHGLIAVADDPQ